MTAIHAFMLGFGVGATLMFLGALGIMLNPSNCKACGKCPY